MLIVIFDRWKGMHGLSLLCLLVLALPLLLVSLFGRFLLLPHVVPEDAHLLVVVLVEVEAKSVSQSYLKEVVVQTLLGNAYFLGSLFKGVLLVLVGLVTGA